MGNDQSKETDDSYPSGSSGNFSLASSSLPARAADDFEGSPYPLSKRPSWNDRNPVVMSPTGESRSRSDARQSLRAHIFRASADELGVPGQNGRQERDHSPGGSNSTMSGSVSPSTPAKQIKRLDVETAISLLQDFKKTATAGELHALQKALAPVGAVQEQGSTCQPKPENTIDPAIANLIRRRSFFTPGVATRTDDPPKLKVPSPRRKSQERAASQVWSEDMFGTSPLAELAKIGPRCDEQDIVKRAMTPPETDYTHLGAHKLGSLRITNGTASPDPNFKSRWPRPSSSPDGRKEEDYYTASEGRASPDASVMSVKNPSALPLYNDKPVNSVDAPRISAKWMPQITVTNPSPDQIANKTTLGRASTVQRKYSEFATNPFGESAEDDEVAVSEDEPSAGEKSDEHTNHNSADNAIVLSYFDEPRGKDPDDYKRRQVIGQENLQVKSLQVPTANSETSSVYVPEAKARLPEAKARLPEAKATPSPTGARVPATDSGYFSGSSVSEQSATEIIPGDNDFGAPLLSSRSAPSLPRLANQARRERYSDSTFNAPTRPILKPASNSSPSPFVLRQARETWPFLEAQRRPPTAPAVPPAATAIASVPRISLTPGISAPVDLSPKSPKSRDTSPRSGPRKLKKKRPVSQQVASTITVQRLKTLTGTKLPEIPSELAMKYDDRLTNNPDMRHLERTYDSVSPNDQMSPPAGVHSPDFNIEYRFPSPERKQTPSTPDRRRRHSSASSQPLQLIKQKLSRRNSLDRNIERAMANREQNVKGFSDLGTTAQSLGISPYDIARNTNGLRNQASERPTQHPHQISSQNTLNKRRVGMDDLTASEFAWQRSRDRADNYSRRRSNAPRPNSFHGSDFEDIISKPDRVRPQSYYSDGHQVPHSGNMENVWRGNRRETADFADPRIRPDHDRSRTFAMKQWIPKENFAPEIVEWGPEPVGRRLAETYNPPAATQPFVDHSVAASSSWDAPAQLWRERRKSAGEELVNRSGEVYDSKDYTAFHNAPFFYPEPQELEAPRSSYFNDPTPSHNLLGPRQAPQSPVLGDSNVRLNVADETPARPTAAPPAIPTAIELPVERSPSPTRRPISPAIAAMHERFSAPWSPARPPTPPPKPSAYVPSGAVPSSRSPTTVGAAAAAAEEEDEWPSPPPALPATTGGPTPPPKLAYTPPAEAAGPPQPRHAPPPLPPRAPPRPPTPHSSSYQDADADADATSSADEEYMTHERRRRRRRSSSSGGGVDGERKGRASRSRRKSASQGRRGKSHGQVDIEAELRAQEALLQAPRVPVGLGDVRSYLRSVS